jgi:2-succinyl-5-enolpyruvyl-6-hydroxy-3-cyclohexene-1-carboxylate synthase
MLLGYPESAEALVRAFSQQACLAEVICVGSATTMRLWNRYAQCQVPTLYLRDLHSTGADGVLSTFLGNAADASFGCCLIGDLTLLRDITAAAILPQLPPGKRIVAVLNNEGAAAAYHDTAGDPELERLLVQPQPFRMQEIARLWGAEYYAIHSEADLEVLDSLDDNCFALLELLPDGCICG